MPRTAPRSILAGLTVGLGATAHAGQPVIGPQIRIDATGAVSADETSAASSDLLPNEIIAGWNDYQGAFGPVRAGFALSLDGGATWESFLFRPPSGYESSVEGDPMTVVDPRTGTMWIGAIAFGGSGGMYVAKKDPGESTFDLPVMVDTTAWVDKGWMAAGTRRGQPDTTRVFCAYNYGLSWSDDMGTTWTAPLPLTQGRAFLPRIGPDGIIYVTCTNNVEGVVRLARSLDDGATFTIHDVATRMDTWALDDNSRFPGIYRVPPITYFDVDATTGTLHVCYFDTSEMVGERFNVDIFYTRSFDQGTTWETPRIVNGDSAFTGDQFHPWLEVDTAGRVHLVYFDTRHTDQDDTAVDAMLDVYYAVSLDGGDTFTEYRLTPQSWNSADDGMGGAENQFIGDYLGIAVTGDRAYPVYLDTSVGQAAIYANLADFTGTCAADLDGDGAVGFGDLLAVLSTWGATGGPEDLDGSGTVGFGDVLAVLAAWGPCPG